MDRRSSLALAALLLALPAAAQPGRSLVLPPGHETAEGTSATSFPFGRATPFRVQEVYWRPNFQGLQGEIVLTGLSFRADGGVKNGPKPFVWLDVYVASTPRPVGALQKAFAENRGPDWTRVFSAVTSLPASPGTTPNPFAVTVPFEAPFPYATEEAGLLVELVVEKQPAGEYSLDSPFQCTSTRSPFGETVNTCLCSTGKPLLVTANESIKLGGNLVLALAQGPPEMPAAVFLGSRRTGPLFGLPLPVDMSPYGAPGCSLLVNLLYAQATKTSKEGVAGFNIAVPFVYELLQVPIYVQALVGDLPANQLGMVYSHGLQVAACGPFAVGRVISSGSAVAPEGQVQVGSAHVVELKYR